MSLTIGEVAALARISVRALHHYDAIGLLRPSARSPAGYRLYTEADVERLQQILFQRELGFSLDAIARALDDPEADRVSALERQRALVLERIGRLQAVLRLVDKTLDHHRRGTSMNANDYFDGFDPAQYEDEVQERWGQTEAYRESKRRTARYGKAEWDAIKAEGEAIEAELAALLAAGVPADDARAADVAERHRGHIECWFYPCDKAMHAALGDSYVADARFTRHYDDRAPGLAAYVRAAIHANAARGS